MKKCWKFSLWHQETDSPPQFQHCNRFSYLSILILHGVLTDYENTSYSRLIQCLPEKIVSTRWWQHPDRVIPNWTPAMRVLLPSPCPSYFVTDHNLIRLKPHSLGKEPTPSSASQVCFSSFNPYLCFISVWLLQSFVLRSCSHRPWAAGAGLRARVWSRTLSTTSAWRASLANSAQVDPRHGWKSDYLCGETLGNFRFFLHSTTWKTATELLVEKKYY